MKFVFGTTCKIDSRMNVDEKLTKAVEAKKYASKQLKPNQIKLFMDGTVESDTAFADFLLVDKDVRNLYGSTRGDLLRK